MPIDAFTLPHITERLDPAVDWQRVLDEGFLCYFWDDGEEKKTGTLCCISRFNGRVSYYMDLEEGGIYPYKNCIPIENNI